MGGVDLKTKHKIKDIRLRKIEQFQNISIRWFITALGILQQLNSVSNGRSRFENITQN